MFCMSLMKDEPARPQGGRGGILKKFPLTPAQADAILSATTTACWSLAANIYFHRQARRDRRHSFAISPP